MKNYLVNSKFIYCLPLLLSFICSPVWSFSADQEVCAAKLKTIKQYDPSFARIDKVYRQSLRFSGTVHRIVPHWHATHQDIKYAKNKLTVNDIPYIVEVLARVDMPNARQRVAIGVLVLFGLQALPCIEAAMKNSEIKGRLTLQQIKIQIGIDQSTTLK